MDIQEAVRVRLRGEEMYDDFLEWYHREYEIKDTDEINMNNKEVRFMQVNKNVVHREIAGEHILIPIGETALHYNGVFAITEVGAEIWKMLCEGKDIPEIITVLLVKYDVEPDVLAIDVESFLNMLRENSLLNDDSVPIQK